jgi:hypothetical protein
MLMLSVHAGLSKQQNIQALQPIATSRVPSFTTLLPVKPKQYFQAQTRSFQTTIFTSLLLPPSTQPRSFPFMVRLDYSILPHSFRDLQAFHLTLAATASPSEQISQDDITATVFSTKSRVACSAIIPSRKADSMLSSIIQGSIYSSLPDAHMLRWYGMMPSMHMRQPSVALSRPVARPPNQRH